MTTWSRKITRGAPSGRSGKEMPISVRGDRDPGDSHNGPGPPERCRAQARRAVHRRVVRTSSDRGDDAPRVALPPRQREPRRPQLNPTVAPQRGQQPGPAGAPELPHGRAPLLPSGCLRRRGSDRRTHAREPRRQARPAGHRRGARWSRWEFAACNRGQACARRRGPGAAFRPTRHRAGSARDDAADPKINLVKQAARALILATNAGVYDATDELLAVFARDPRNYGISIARVAERLEREPAKARIIRGAALAGQDPVLGPWSWPIWPPTTTLQPAARPQQKAGWRSNRPRKRGRTAASRSPRAWCRFMARESSDAWHHLPRGPHC
jgi:hypothetical protein